MRRGEQVAGAGTAAKVSRAGLHRGCISGWESAVLRLNRAIHREFSGAGIEWQGLGQGTKSRHTLPEELTLQPFQQGADSDGWNCSAAARKSLVIIL
jgi:hypothetical protein